MAKNIRVNRYILATASTCSGCRAVDWRLNSKDSARGSEMNVDPGEFLNR